MFFHKKTAKNGELGLLKKYLFRDTISLRTDMLHVCELQVELIAVLWSEKP